MADLNTEFEVAVIDEAQLFGDESRGWAWTQAFLGLKAKVCHTYKNFLVISFPNLPI
jgi:ATP-dependent RNA helicase SUPV3L1/SUV3